MVGEAADLFLPLGLERGGGYDEHAGGAAEAVEEGAGGDGLDGLAEAHLVGEEGPFLEGEVEHALALVGKKRILRDVLRVAAGGDAGLVVAAEEDAFAGAAAGVEPGGDLLRDAQGGGGGSVFAEAGDGGLGLGLGEEEAVGGEEGAEAGGEGVEVALDAQGVGGGVGDEVDAGGAGDAAARRASFSRRRR